MPAVPPTTPDPSTAAVNPVLAVATRSGAVESWHRGAVVVVHGDEVALRLGDVERPVFARSAVKPLQALPFLERGLDSRLGLPADELAVMCASHDGASVHTAAVRSFLARGGLREDQLGCGPHAPFDQEARLALLRGGERPARVHNNCSGKHTGFLHLAAACGDDLGAYLDPDCRSQREVNAAVAAMAGLDAPLPTGLDGCGAPTFVLPLVALARSFCRLANPTALPAVRGDACRRILHAVGQAPSLLAGERRYCTALLRQWPGRVFAKNGAEGVYAVALAPDPARRRWPQALGIAVKVDDGHERGYQPVLVDLLQRLGALPAVLPRELAPFAPVPIDNTQKKRVGEVASVAPWELP
ncbi:MAG: asparaginase [Planctomycetes bacterium]|nr:asparaginase [Planctomycetota bacterium]